MIIRDKYGYPVEIVKGKHISNFLRYAYWIDFKQTWNRRKNK